MAKQELLLIFGYLLIGGIIGTFYAEARGKSSTSLKHSLYSIWPVVIGLIGFLAVALLVK